MCIRDRSTTPSTGSSKSEATAGSASAKIAASNDPSSLSRAPSSSFARDVDAASPSVSPDALVRWTRRAVGRRDRWELDAARRDAAEPPRLRWFKRPGLDGASHACVWPRSERRVPGPDGTSTHLAAETRAHRSRLRHSCGPGVIRAAVGGARDTAAHRMPAHTESDMRRKDTIVM